MGRWVGRWCRWRCRRPGCRSRSSRMAAGVRRRGGVVGGRLAGRGGGGVGGAMVSVALPAARVQEQIESYGGRVSVAAVNGPAAVVVSGEPGVLDELLAGWGRDGVRARRVPVDYASHSVQ